MSLPAPVLDSRRFDDLVREARERIPRYTPEWTNLNDSDPGLTLVKLHAWMTETILYELNRVPDLNYIKFLDLLGVTPMPAHPALTELSFTLDKLEEPNDPLVVPVPLATKVAVDDPDLPREVVFETDRTLPALNVHVGAIFVHSDDAGLSRELVTRYDAGTTWLHTFDPFDPGFTPNTVLYLGLLLRPNVKPPLNRYIDDSLPAGPLDLYVDAVQVFDKDPAGAVIEGPLSRRCADPAGAGIEPVKHIDWQIFTGAEGQPDLFADDNDSGWTNLAVSSDGTIGLTRSGHLVLELPAGATPVSPVALSVEFWDSFGQPKPPQTQDELIAALETGELDILEGLADYWEAMGVEDEADLAAFAACGESVPQTVDKIKKLATPLQPKNLTLADWIGINEGFAVDLPVAEDDLRRLYWIRARIKTGYGIDDDRPSALRALHLNTVSATQASTRLDEALGRSTGRPVQVFTLPKIPVLIDPQTGTADLTLTVTAAGVAETWERVGDFFNSGPDSPHYLLDPGAGRITFGDGQRGRIPVADAAVTATRYRVGGGAIGNVSADTVTKIKGRIRNVTAATNIRAAHDGSDEEALDDVKLRAPHDLRARDRAVSAQDFVDLAMQTPGVALHKAFALGRKAVGPVGALVDRDGSVTMVVLPDNAEATPQPSEAQLWAICQWLEPRRLITTELHIIGPDYAAVTALSARITVRNGYDLAAVSEGVYAALLEFLHPIRGGADGTGWPFGDDIYHGDIYEVILAVDGVRRASALKINVDGAPGSSVTDITVLPDGHLPVLTRDVIELLVAYE